MAAKKQKLFYGLFEDGIRDLGKSRHLCVRPVAFWAWLCVSATRNQKCFPASAFPLPHTSVRCRHLRHRHAEVVSRVLTGTHGEVKGDPNTQTHRGSESSVNGDTWRSKRRPNTQTHRGSESSVNGDTWRNKRIPNTINLLSQTILYFLSGFNYLRITFLFSFKCFTCCYHT